MNELNIGKFTLVENTLMWRGKEVCDYTDFKIILNSLKGKVDNRVIKVDNTQGKFILKTQDNRIILLDIIESTLVAKEIELIRNNRISKLSLLEQMLIHSEDEELGKLFEDSIRMENYYYLCIAKANKLNTEVSNKCMYSHKEEIIKAFMIIETSALVKLGVLDKDKVNNYFSEIESSDVFSIIRDILKSNGCNLKKKIKSVDDLTKAYVSNIGSSYMFPLYRAVDEEKLANSKSIYDFDTMLESDLNLKYLKVLKLLDTSKSTKLVINCYNTLLDEFNCSQFKISNSTTIKYTNTFKAHMKVMQEVLRGIKSNNANDIEILAIGLQDKLNG